ncbi:MAG: hypothetical protein ABI457_13235, partial [Hyphomicrobium sp.]
KVHFTDGSVGEFDLVVAATGFNNSIPFLPKSIVRVENDIVQVYGGAFPDTVKNLYVVGWAQPRNGFGAIISPAAKLYAEMIALQDEIDLPIGYVLKWRGLKVPTTHLVDPAATRRVIWIAHRVLPLLKRRARIIGDQYPRPQFDPSLHVFDGADGAVAVNA